VRAVRLSEEVAFARHGVPLESIDPALTRSGRLGRHVFSLARFAFHSGVRPSGAIEGWQEWAAPAVSVAAARTRLP
jgi:hypothetical protein